MNIFLRRIPANTKHAEITEFLAPALHRGLFRKAARILNVEIMALQDARQGTTEFHGLVALDSEMAVQYAIKALKNKRLNGRHVLVRRYYHRSWYNDPRQHQNAAGSNVYIEKRRGDRRRGSSLEVIKNASDQFNSEDDFFKSIKHPQFLVNFVVPIKFEEAVADCFVHFELEQSRHQLLDQTLEHRITRFLTEQIGPDGKTRRFQIYAEKNDIAALMERLNQDFKGSGIHYWVTPVVESGQI